MRTVCRLKIRDIVSITNWIHLPSKLTAGLTNLTTVSLPATTDSVTSENRLVWIFPLSRSDRMVLRIPRWDMNHSQSITFWIRMFGSSQTTLASSLESTSLQWEPTSKSSNSTTHSIYFAMVCLACLLRLRRFHPWMISLLRQIQAIRLILGEWLLQVRLPLKERTSMWDNSPSMPRMNICCCPTST